MLRDNNYHFLRAESKVIIAKQVWQEYNLGIFSSEKPLTSLPRYFILVFK